MFDIGKTGFCLGTSLLVGSTLAELITGRLLDLFLYMNTKRHSSMRRVDFRLYPTCVIALAMPVGLIVYVFGVQYKTHRVTLLVRVACGGLRTGML